jgi:hypothetical protein
MILSFYYKLTFIVYDTPGNSQGQRTYFFNLLKYLENRYIPEKGTTTKATKAPKEGKSKALY